MLRKKNFNILGRWGGVHEKPIQRGHCLKEGPWPVFWFKGGLGKKEGGGGFEGGLIPQCTLWDNLNKLRAKLSLFMKSGQFMSYSKGNKLIKKIYKNCGLKTSFKLLSVFKRLSTTSLGKFLRKSTYIRYVIAELSKLVQISMLASSDSFKKKGWPLFYRIFFKTILQCYINWPNFITRLFSSHVIQ